METLSKVMLFFSPLYADDLQNAGLSSACTLASVAGTVYANPTSGITYTATATNGACTSTATSAVSVTNTSISATPNNPTTCSGTNGSIDLSGLTNGTLYTVNYKKNGVSQTPLSLTAASGIVTISSLSAGSYTNITVTAGSCTTSAPASATLSDPAAPSISGSSSANPTTCSGSNGTITLNGLANSTTYTVNYSKNGSAQTPASIATNGSGSLVMTGLNSATYSAITVTLPATGCVSSSVGPFTLSDPATPVIGTTSSTDPTTCSGSDGTITLNGLSNSTNYTVNYSKNGSVQSPASIMTNGSGSLILTGLNAATYSTVSVSLSSCVSSSVGPFTLSDPPAPSISGTSSSNPTTCTGTDGAITLSGLSNSTTYTVNYSRNGSVQTPASIMTDGSGNLVMTGLNAATYSTISVTHNNCTSSPVGPFTLTDPPAPSVTAGNNGPVCYNTILNLTATNVAGGTYSWTGPNGYTSTSQNPSPTSNVDDTYAGVYSVTATANNCTSAVSTTTVTVNPDTWTGAVNADWNNAANWCGGVPTSSMPVSIPSGTPHDPTLPSSTTITNTQLVVASGATITIPSGSSLDVSGDVAINGAIAGSGTVVMNGAGAQTITGTGTVANLELNNSAGASISSGNTLNVTGVVTLTSGTLATNDGLVLVSDASGTGSIGAITGGAINGNVVEQRYIPAGRRCYRFFSHPYNSTVALNPQLTSQIDVTGVGGAANGFTPTQTNNGSAFWYNPLKGNPNPGGNGNDPGWTAFTSANATSGPNGWKPFEGIRVLVRGALGQGLNGGTYTPSAATLHLVGQVNTGLVHVPVVKGSLSCANILGNPYPSPVDIGPILYNSSVAGLISGSSFWVWDANQGTLGAYVPVLINSSTHYDLPSGGAFTVNVTANGNIDFNESDKVASGTSLFKTTANNLDLVEFHVFSNHDSIEWDRTFTVFNDQAANTIENHDGVKVANPSLNFYSLSADGKKLSVDARPFVNNMVIPMGFKTDEHNQYKIKVQNLHLPANYHLYLIDNYLNTVQPIEMGTEYVFDITADSLSQGDNRFQLNGSIESTTAVNNTVATNTSNFIIAVAPNPAVDMTNISFEGAKTGSSASIAITNVNGMEVYNVNVKDAVNGKVSVPLQNLAAGIYIVKVTCGSDIITQRLVKE